MKIFEGWDNLPPIAGAVVTVGSFDGVHRGHRALLDRLVERARSGGGESVVVTFSPHPREVLGDGVRLLTTLPEKAALLGRAGVDNLVVVPFTQEFSRLSGREFVGMLSDKIGMKTLVAGYNHRFGHDRIGVEDLDAEFDVEVVPRHGGASSTIIRRLLEEGRTQEAEEYLGHE